jgi:hypothetical protein
LVWTSVTVSAVNVPAETSFLRFTAGIDQGGTGSPFTGYWDQLSAVVSLAPPVTNTARVTSGNSDRSPSNDLAEAIAYVEPPLDRDGDGMPDWWEWRHFGGVVSGIATNDSDGDHATDGWEYLADTDPTLDHSVLRIQATRLDGNTVLLSFPASPDRVYALERFEQTLEDWLQVGAEQFGKGTFLVDVGTTGFREDLYRIRVRLSSPEVP